jgi:hypothetical protein
LQVPSAQGTKPEAHLQSFVDESQMLPDAQLSGLPKQSAQAQDSFTSQLVLLLQGGGGQES